jgi:hypothetical protein
MELRDVVGLLSEPQKCYGHCDQMASPHILKENRELIVGMVCHAGYVSRIMTYSFNLDLGQFKSFIAKSLGPSIELADQDLRTATRFPWDLGLVGSESEPVKVAYWTQNYRGSKKDDTNRPGLFMCSNCGALYVQPVSAKAVLCPSCRN